MKQKFFDQQKDCRRTSKHIVSDVSRMQLPSFSLSLSLSLSLFVCFSLSLSLSLNGCFVLFLSLLLRLFLSFSIMSFYGSFMSTKRPFLSFSVSLCLSVCLSFYHLLFRLLANRPFLSLAVFSLSYSIILWDFMSTY